MLKDTNCSSTKNIFKERSDMFDKIIMKKVNHTNSTTTKRYNMSNKIFDDSYFIKTTHDKICLREP